MFNGARILVAPLDWGLGHAARCVPVVRSLIEHGAVPVIGAEGGPLALLRAEFPDLEHVRLAGVTVRYANGKNQSWSMARQFPKLLRGIREEHSLFFRLKDELALDAVISDQRFGIRATTLPSVIITHQVFPIAPIFQGPLQRLNQRLLQRFDRCWVMDHAEPPGLSGELGHGPNVSPNARCIGPQSRFSPQVSGSPAQGRIVAVISGPEPHRTLFEKILIDQLQMIPGDHLLVRGLPSAAHEQRANVTLLPHLSADRLADELSCADLIVSRSGYTTLMDLHALGRNALLVPTPGQPEQEYLARLHGTAGHFMVQQQDRIDLCAAMASLKGTSSPPIVVDHRPLERALEDLAAMIQHRRTVTFSRT